MHVLQILINNSPDVVSREQLISEVWDNYGGADDALNQAISNLRKVLGDEDRDNRLIETVVKKGYRFNGTVKQVSAKKRNSATNYFGLNPKVFLLLIITSITIITIIIFLFFLKDNAIAPVAPSS